MEKNEKIGYNIRTIMENLTLQEFADSIGVTVRALSNYLAGRVPRKSVLQKICDRYGVVPRWLLTGEGPMYRDEQAAQTTDASVILNITDQQHVENIEHNKKETTDVSVVLRLQQELMEALREQNRLTQENADLRIQLERKDSRIRDLERENAEIPVLKARIAELELELSERPKLPKTVPVDVSDKSKPTPGHGTGADKTVVPGAGAGDPCAGSLGASVRGGG